MIPVDLRNYDRNNKRVSNLILPILSQVVEGLPEEEQLNLSEEDKNKVSEIINGLENQENVDELKALFGIE